MRSDFAGPVNIGSDEMVTINELAERIMKIAGKSLSILSWFSVDFDRRLILKIGELAVNDQKIVKESLRKLMPLSES